MPACLAALVLLVSACDAQSPSVESDAVQYSGEELYSGFLLVSGPVADLFPEVFSPEAYSAAELREMLSPSEYEAVEAQLAAADLSIEDVSGLVHRYRTLDGAELAEKQLIEMRLIGHIREADPAFFDWFAAEMQSGNQLRISAAMERAYELHQAAVLGVLDIDLDAYVDRVTAIDSAAGKGVVQLALAVAYVAAVGAAVVVGLMFGAVNLSYVYNATRFWNVSIPKRDTGNREYFINTIAQRLALPSS